MPRLRAVADGLRTSFFFLPAVAVVVGFLAARLLVGVDAGDWVGRSTVDSARTVMSTTAAATMTFTSITFSVSLLIMQQGSSQFSPRVIHGLLRDPFNRRVIAVVMGTFTYCLVTLQRIRGPVAEGGEEVVPELSVVVGLLLGVVAVLSVIAAINHTSQKLDVSVILGDIVEQATDVPIADRSTADYEAMGAAEHPPFRGFPTTIVRFDTDGWIREIDRARLLRLAEPGGVVRLETDTGRYAIRSTPLCTVWPAVPEDRLDELTRAARGAVRVGPTRTMSEDAGYGVRQLVDVALKALSPGVNDPTTAQDAIFHLATVLVHRLTGPPVPSAYRDDEGRQLLVPHAMTDDELADLAFSELRRTAATDPAVTTYLLQAIGLVVDGVRAEGQGDRVAPLLEQARLIIAHVEGADLLDDDRHALQRTYRSLVDD